MRILICIPHDLMIPKGNSIAALRLMAGFEEKGHHVLVLENCETKDRNTVAASVRSFMPDISVVMHAWRCAAAFQGIWSTGDSPVIVSLRGTDINEMIDDANQGPVICSVLEGCQGITVFSDSSRRRVIKYLPASEGKVRVIPNGLNLPASAVDYRQKLGISRDAFVVAGLAGIRQIKRLFWLIDMLSQVRAKGIDLIYIHGGPVLEKRKGELFQELCAREPWLYYGGIIPHSEVSSFLKAGDMFVSASRSEGMPHAVREAMLVGLPCLLSDIEGHRTMARDDREALFFDNGDSFISKAHALIHDSALRKHLAENGSIRIKNELSRVGEIDAYLALFEALT
ncbi:MAG: hypothetical protein C0392_04610 [Syntrophus sp. (in: bacteria)]|nr:hypothetical protein [Syntrophus sp. (in: bacteria)]